MLNTSFIQRYRLNHLLIWLLVLGAWYYLRMDDYTDKGMGFFITVIKVTDLALMVYLTNYLLIPKLLYRKSYLLFVLFFIAMVLASSIIKMNIIGQLQNNPALYNWTANWKARLYDNIIPHFFLVIAGVAIKLLIDFGRLQTRMAETARGKAEAELNFLKSQINPHFVFNSLNSVYFLIDKNNSEARKALHQFSEMLRYQLYEIKDDKVPVEKEVRYLKDYVELQQLRKDEKYTVDFDCSDTVKGFFIEPLLLVPLLENAFKHISHYTDKANHISVSFNYSHPLFQFKISNSKESVPVSGRQGGIGLQNVKQRLRLLYPERHLLEIIETADLFEVQLQIQIS